MRMHNESDTHRETDHLVVGVVAVRVCVVRRAHGDDEFVLRVAEQARRGARALRQRDGDSAARAVDPEERPALLHHTPVARLVHEQHFQQLHNVQCSFSQYCTSIVLNKNEQ